jgi:hypothetical protein
MEILQWLWIATAGACIGAGTFFTIEKWREEERQQAPQQPQRLLAAPVERHTQPGLRRVSVPAPQTEPQRRVVIQQDRRTGAPAVQSRSSVPQRRVAAPSRPSTQPQQRHVVVAQRQTRPATPPAPRRVAQPRPVVLWDE